MRTGPVPSPLDRIVIEVRDGSEPFEGGWAILLLPMWDKNEYAVMLGPADGRGRIEAPWAEVLADCDQERSLALMDYLDPRVGWTGSMGVVVMDGAAVDRALAAFRRFQRPEAYPRDFEAQMATLSARLAGRPTAGLTARLM